MPMVTPNSIRLDFLHPSMGGGKVQPTIEDQAPSIEDEGDGRHPPKPQALKSRVLIIGSLVRSSPFILLLPCVVLGLIVGLGCFGISRARQQLENEARDQAYLVAEGFAWNLKLGLSVEGFPLGQVETLVKHDPNYTHAMANLGAAWAGIWKRVPAGAVSMAIAPMGKVVDVYPPNAPSMFGIGYDILNSTLDRALAIRAILNTDYNEQGPVIQVRSTPFGYLNVGIIPIFAANTSANDNFNIPWSISHPLAANFTYSAALGGKLWGFAIISIDTAQFAILGAAVMRLNQGGYTVQGMRPGVEAAGEPPMVPVLPIGMPPSHSVGADIAYPDEIWTTYVWKTGSSDWDQAPWLHGMYAVVAVAGFIISVLLFAVLLSRLEHQSLLHSLLPKQAIQRMRDEGQWMCGNQKEELTALTLETPAGLMLKIIDSVLDNRTPSIQQLLNVKDALQHSADVYRPGNSQLQGCMKESEFVDAEVRQALMAQLLGNERFSFLTEGRSTSAGESRSLQPSVSGRSFDVASRRGSMLMLATGEVDWSAQDLPGVLKYLASTNAAIQKEEEPQSKTDASTESALPEGCTDAQSSLSKGDAGAIVATGAVDAGMQPLPSPRALTLQLDSVLATADRWQFDVFALETASNGRPLSTLAYTLLHQTGLKTWAHMDTGKLVRFLQQVEDSYPDNPYHNRRHAAAVLQAVHVIVVRGGMVPGFVDQLTQLSCYLAAIVHDVGHKGCNNDFLVNSHDELAIAYNDKSPLENYHVAAAFRLLSRPELNCLSALSKSNWTKLRKLVIELVLGTDMKAHFATLGQFEALVKSDATSGRPSISERPTGNSSRAGHNDTKGDVESGLIPLAAAPGQKHVLLPVSDTDKLFSLQVAMKLADVGHLTSPLHLHLKWVTALEEEFFRQGDAEKKAGLNVSPLCDRSKEGVTKSQVGFFDFVVIPMFKAFCNRFTDCKPLWDALMDNYKHWVAAAAAAQRDRTSPTVKAHVETPAHASPRIKAVDAEAGSSKAGGLRFDLPPKA